MPIKQPYVIDAGFNEFLKQSMFNEKENIQRVQFYYPLPSSGDVFLLRAEKVSCSKTLSIINKDFENNPRAIDLIKNYSNDYTCITIKPNNWFIAKFVPPLIAVYEKNNASIKLKMYRGKANFSNKKGQYPQVTIFYQDTYEKTAMH